MIDNKDQHTSHLINKKWISTKTQFANFDEFKEDIEFNETISFKDGFTYEYQKEGSYLENGGYVVNLDIQGDSYEKVKTQLQNLKDSHYINNQTRMIVTDMMFYNPYT